MVFPEVPAAADAAEPEEGSDFCQVHRDLRAAARARKSTARSWATFQARVNLIGAG